jgi:hypothetical protein
MKAGPFLYCEDFIHYYVTVYLTKRKSKFTQLECNIKNVSQLLNTLAFFKEFINLLKIYYIGACQS